MNQPPSVFEALLLWFKIGCLSFGGPSGQIALLHNEIVEKRAWVSDEEFVRALQFCMLLPGPEAQQLATYLGWRLHGIKGGIVAGALFLLPAVVLLWGLSFLYVNGQSWPLLMAFFAGLKPAVVAIVAAACWRIGKRMVTTAKLAVIALIALTLFSFIHVSFPLIVLGFGLFGACTPKEKRNLPFLPESPSVTWSQSLITAFSIIALWIMPMALLLLWLGHQALPVKVGFEFAKVAVMSFGGAYAALSYVSLHAAGDWGWITSGQMMDGLGLAETTPGPLLIALQYVAFLAAYKTPGVLSPLGAATLASLTACWSLFLPSFLWIFSLAPHMEQLGRNPRIAGALSAIGAVVTAVIAHLALWFAGSLFFPHGTLESVDWMSVLIALASFLVLQSKRIGMIPVILLSGLIGMVMKIV